MNRMQGFSKQFPYSFTSTQRHLHAMLAQVFLMQGPKIYRGSLEAILCMHDPFL